LATPHDDDDDAATILVATTTEFATATIAGDIRW